MKNNNEYFLEKYSRQIIMEQVGVEGQKKINKIENNKLKYNVYFDSTKLDLVKFEKLIKSNANGRNKIYFFLIHNNKK